jgi:hypothetical protein
LAEVCATVYAIWVERIQAERQVAAVLTASGQYEGELPSLYDLDVALGMVESPESDLTPEQRELRRELGLSAG